MNRGERVEQDNGCQREKAEARLLRQDRRWVLEMSGAGDLTMEQLAATARADMFIDTFGRELLVRATGVPMQVPVSVDRGASGGKDLEGARFINRELSWLAFNERVLEEAADATNPLLERVKFATIVASNLDEFFMVRVAGLHHAAAEGDQSLDPAGMTAAQQLAAVTNRAQALMTALYDLVLDDVLPGLARAGIRILRWQELSSAQQRALATFFQEAVLPVLTPLAIDASRPFPLLSSLTLNLALRLEPARDQTEHRLAIVQVPSGLARLVPLDAQGEYILLEEVIAAHLDQLFPGQVMLESVGIRLARDAELELDDEGGRTHLELVERQLRRRRRSSVGGWKSTSAPQRISSCGFETTWISNPPRSICFPGRSICAC